MTTDEIAEMRRMAMAATPGPWFAHVYVDMRSDDARPGVRFISAGMGNLADDVDEHDAAFIASTNPSAILRLLDRVEELDHECQQSMLTIALERERAEAAERQRDEALAKLARAEDALRPFAAFASSVEEFVAARASDGGSPIMPTKAFRLADFERAAAALAPQGGEGGNNG